MHEVVWPEGDSPPLDTATTIGERSRIEGKIKSHNGGLSVTLTKILLALAC
jgi:hypothetical protein